MKNKRILAIIVVLAAASAAPFALSCRSADGRRQPVRFAAGFEASDYLRRV